MGIDNNIIHITNVSIRDTFGGYRTGKTPGKCFGNMAASYFGNSADARHNSWETSIRCHLRFCSDSPAKKLLAFRIAILTMSWTLSAIVLCGTLAVFAAGTLGDRMFGFGFPMLDGERHRNYRREDTEGAHNASFGICTREIEELTEPLRCNEEYMRAVCEEIERSNCVNELYHPDTDGYDESDVCVVNDERVNVALCSDACATNQFFYIPAVQISRRRASATIERMWGGAGTYCCIYNDKGYCGREPFGASNLPTIYEECFKKNNMDASICSDECKEALEYMKEEQGCCMHIYFVIPLGLSHNDVGLVTLSEELLSACEIEIPGTCKSFPPPEKFLECAHDGDVHVSPTIFCSVVLIMVSLLNAT